MRALVWAFALVAHLAVASQEVFQVINAGWEKSPQPGGEAGVLVLHIRVADGWHINGPNPKDAFLIPTKVVLTVPEGWRAGKAQFPEPQEVKLAVFEQAMEVLAGDLWISIPIQAPLGAQGQELRGVFVAQACNNTSCLPPKEVSFSVPWGAVLQPPATVQNVTTPPPPSNANGLRPDFAQASFWLQLVLVFLGGLALNLTPCVYPIIPVTVGFFLSQTGTKTRTVLLAITYVLGMALTYSTLGVGAALTGKLFGAALQSPWVTGFIVIVVLALAASMFGLWEIRVPSRIAGAAGGRRGVAGSLFMGLIVGLVAAPCIGPFVLGLLAYVGQKQSALLGFFLFFTLALGLGLPYIFLAISAKSLAKLPNSGAWMEGVRQVFGVVLVALAAYFARPLMPHLWGERALAATLVLGSVYLAVFARPGREVGLVDRMMRLVTIVMVLVGAFLWPHQASEEKGSLAWEPASFSTLEEAIGSGEPTIVDFYADWCLPCKELDEKTFSHPAVREKLLGFRRLKVNLTKSTPEAERLRQAYSVVGVPTVLFFHFGKEVSGSRLTGFEPPEAFLRRLASVTETN